MTDRARKPLLCFVVGARPNFVKAGPVVKAALASGSFRTLLVHTGQHYDEALSDLFFRDLSIPPPDLLLEVGSGSHAVQTAEVMRRIEPVLVEHRPDCLLVFGDVNSTFAAALTAVKLGIPVAHVESGLRSYDREMPEEINRKLTDAISDLLFTTEESAADNLAAEGVSQDKVHFVGNTMIDSLCANLDRARQAQPELLEHHRVTAGGYAVLTLHRPSNVDRQQDLETMLGAIAQVATELPIIFPVHPRTQARLQATAEIGALLASTPALRLCAPFGYLEFLALLDGARLALTDSGGIQEETTALGVPCLTLRDNTERPITLTAGTNTLAGTRAEDIVRLARAELARPLDRGRATAPPLWDGAAASRLITVLEQRLVAPR